MSVRVTAVLLGMMAIVLVTLGPSWGIGPRGVAYTPGEVMLRWAPRLGKAAAREQVVARLAGRLGSISVEPLLPASVSLAKPAGGQNLQRWTRVRYTTTEDPAIAAAECAGIEGVEVAQPNYLHAFAESVNDSLYPAQWGLTAMGWGQPAEVDAQGVIVGVVDSGVDYTHPDIAAQIWRNPGEAGGVEGVDDDGNGYTDDLIGWDFSDAPDLPGEGDYLVPDNDPADESGHGTHVAGTIAAIANNRLGIAGVAPGARIMVLRAGFTLGGSGYLEDDDAAAAIAYAADNGARVVNLSWGDPRFSALLLDAVHYADRAGCLLVAAAGNDGKEEVFFPARLGETMAVTAIGPDLLPLSFSNWGPTVDLAAPGSGILSLVPGGTYGERSGTSMAAAHVSGLAALVASRHPDWTADQVRGALLVSARDLGTRGWDSRTGVGLAQVAALQIEDPPVVRVTTPGWGESLTGDAEIVLAVGAVERWELSWGAGGSPAEWTTQATGSADTVTAVTVAWPTEALAPGPYQLRLVGHQGGREIEDRVEVEVARGGPEAISPRVTRLLAGSSWTHLVEWSTAVPAAGVVYLTDAAGTERQVTAPPGLLTQRLELPHDLPADVYRVEVQAQAGGLSGPRVIAGEAAVTELHWPWSLTSRACIPSGYAMPEPADLDLDGHPELMVMPDDGGRYASPRTYRLRRDGMELVHTSPLLFIPWGVRDRDGDGWPEVMAVDAGRVRFVESGTRSGFPERVVWEEPQVWGGEDADLDADGRPESYLRGTQGEIFKVLEATADDRFATVEVLANPTAGTNLLGIRQVAADLDGDGRGEFLAGDADGDLFAYEAVADNAFRVAWTETDPLAEGDARVVGAGADLDADGRAEFAVARRHQDPLRVEGRGWTVAVYQAVADNRFSREWAIPVLGGEGDGGIAAADLDADGRLELILALAPDLYVLSSGEPGRYEPRWHTRIRTTQRPLAGDLDGDGRAELAANTADGLTVFSLPTSPPGLPDPPGSLVARSLGPDRILLTWEPVARVAGYLVRRDGEVIAPLVIDTTFTNTGLTPGQTYLYTVAAIDSVSGAVGPATSSVAIRPEAGPRVLTVSRDGARCVAVTFATPVAISYREPYRLRVDPEPGVAQSVLLDQGGRRALLGFAADLPDSGAFTLVLEGVTTSQGTLPDSVDRRFVFRLGAEKEPVRLLGVEALDPSRILLRFSGPVTTPPEPGARIEVSPGPVRILAARATGSELELDLDPETPLRPLGQRYEIEVHGLATVAGDRVDGTIALAWATLDLAGVRPIPNPFLPERGPMTFAFLPARALVSVHDLRGHLIRTLVEADGDGGVAWDGRNEKGEEVGSGIYLYRVTAVGESFTGKVALVRR